MRRGLVGLVVAWSLAVALAAVTAPPPASATAKERSQMLSLVNKARHAHGERALDLDWDLWKLARKHSLDMCADGELYHSTNLSSKLSFTTWRTYGENVGVGTSVKGLFKAFMASDAHRANILNRDFREIGIAFAHEGDIVWVTMIFYG